MLDDENLEYFSNNYSKKRKDAAKVNEDDDCTIENNYKPKVDFSKENLNKEKSCCQLKVKLV
jgi:hypothetical protein